MMIVPGCPNAVMMAGAGDPLDEWHKIAASVRLNAPDAAHLSWTNVTPTDQTKWTAVLWLKRTLLAANQCILSGKSGTTTAEVAFDTAEKLTYRGLVDSVGATQGALDSVRVFRDGGAYMPLLLNYDASRAAASRIQAYTEDAEVAFSVTTNIGTCNMNTAGATMRLGRTQYNSNTNYAGFNVAEFYFIDGQALLPDQFWRRHPRTGQCRPIQFAGTYGNNGRHYDFKDGSAATSAALGKDRSGNNNDATPNNISVAAGAGCDWQRDSPTFNCANFSALITKPGATVTDGGLTVVAPGGAYWYNSAAPFIITSDTTAYWEYEVTANDTNGIALGLASVDWANHGQYSTGSMMVGYGAASYSFGVIATNAGGSISGSYQSGSLLAANLAAPAGSIIRFAVKGGKVWVGLSGSWLYGGDPGTDTPMTGAPSFAGKKVIPTTSNIYPNTWAVNFGQRPWSYSSPWEKSELSTKNLPIKPAGPMKSADAFVAVTDTGANIQAALAALRTGFGSYIDIIKRRDASEGWRWIFSDDPTNYLDTSTTNAKAAVPAFSGTSYAGNSLRVSASNGITTGTFVHVNGAASVISDGLSNVRKMIILHRESAGGGAFFAYHPDLTAGKLIYLNTTDAETTDASIGSVTASGFTAAASLPSGTYRWVSVAELAGFIDLIKYQGNGIADGAVAATSGQPGFFMAHRITPAGMPHMVVDSARDTYNVATRKLAMNMPDAENTGTIGTSSEGLVDLNSNCVKNRATNSTFNGGGGETYVGVSINAFPFRYANAR